MVKMLAEIKTGDSGIEWADESWNYWWGCLKVSPGCNGCYAERFTKGVQGRDFDVIRYIPNSLDKPLRPKFREPTRFFVNAFSDFFDIRVPDSERDKVIEVMKQSPQHVYIILTKRPRIARQYLSKFGKLPENWWFGVSVESEQYLWRIHELRDIPQISTRIVSIEPLIDHIDERELAKAIGPHYEHPGASIDWIITGGESGPSPRKCDPNWIRSVRDVCFEYNIPFFLKQHGGRRKCAHGSYGCCVLDGKIYHQYPEELQRHPSILRRIDHGISDAKACSEVFGEK